MEMQILCSGEMAFEAHQLPSLSVREYASFGRSENNGLRHQP